LRRCEANPEFKRLLDEAMQQSGSDGTMDTRAPPNPRTPIVTTYETPQQNMYATAGLPMMHGTYTMVNTPVGPYALSVPPANGTLGRYATPASNPPMVNTSMVNTPMLNTPAGSYTPFAPRNIPQVLGTHVPHTASTQPPPMYHLMHGMARDPFWQPTPGTRPTPPRAYRPYPAVPNPPHPSAPFPSERPNATAPEPAYQRYQEWSDEAMELRFGLGWWRSRKSSPSSRCDRCGEMNQKCMRKFERRQTGPPTACWEGKCESCYDAKLSCRIKGRECSKWDLPTRRLG
jgi:hypothetical protein